MITFSFCPDSAQHLGDAPDSADSKRDVNLGHMRSIGASHHILLLKENEGENEWRQEVLRCKIIHTDGTYLQTPFECRPQGSKGNFCPAQLCSHQISNSNLKLL